MAKAMARSIKSRRDYHGATALASKLRQHATRETEAERRLQALLHEIEKFDPEDDAADDVGSDIAEDVGELPRRRWSDDTLDRE